MPTRSVAVTTFKMTEVELVDDGGKMIPLIQPDARIFNCLRAAPALDSPYFVLFGNQTHEIRGENQLELDVEPLLGIACKQAFATHGITAYMQDDRVALCQVLSEERRLVVVSDKPLLYVPRDLAICVAPSNLCIFIAVAGCLGVDAFFLTRGGTKIEGPFQLPETRNLSFSMTASCDGFLAAVSLDGCVFVWDDVLASCRGELGPARLEDLDSSWWGEPTGKPSPNIWNAAAKKIDASRAVPGKKKEEPEPGCYKFSRPPGLVQTDFITSIQMRRFEGVMRLAVGWNDGRVDVFARGEMEWERFWFLSPKEKFMTKFKLQNPSLPSSAALAVFCPTKDLVAVNTVNGTILFFRGTDRMLVSKECPVKEGAELKGMDATADGLLLWYRDEKRIIKLQWPDVEVCPPDSNFLTQQAEMAKKHAQTGAPKKKKCFWNPHLLEVAEGTIYHRPSQGKLTVFFSSTLTTVPVNLPFGARTTLRVDATYTEEFKDPVIDAEDVLIARGVVGIVSGKYLLVYRIWKKTWTAVKLPDCAKKGALSLSTEMDIAAVASVEGKVYCLNMDSGLRLGAPVDLPGPASSMIGCSNSGGMFAALGKLDPPEEGKPETFLAIVVPRMDTPQPAMYCLEQQTVGGKSPGCLLGLWRIPKVFVMMFEVPGGKYLAVAYKDQDLRIKEWKVLSTAKAGGNVSRLVRENNVPWCFEEEE